MTTAEAEQIKARPILFSGPMVQTILSDKKTQTRRVVRPQPPSGWDRHCWYDESIYGWTSETEISDTWHKAKCRYGKVGDRLWVRETFALIWPSDSPPEEIQENTIEYRANTDGRCPPGHWPGELRDHPDCPRWRSSLHMPRWASRITLEVTEIRCERLQEIGEEDAIAEGVERVGDLWKCYGDCPAHTQGHDKRTSAIASFMSLWDSINGEKHAWESNPWVFVVEFGRVQL